MRKTPLYDSHLKLGARMVEFAGFSMPLHYGSIKAEHMAVREGVGVFDVSHMGEIWVVGGEAAEFLDFATTNRASALKVGRAQYTMIPNKRGGVVDDAYLYLPDREGRFLLVVNAANTEKDYRHLKRLAAAFDVEVYDASEETALLAVQGPGSQELLDGLTDVHLEAYRRNRVFRGNIAGRPALFARTGYTGEDGFEIFLVPEDAPAVFEALIEAGAVPAGLGARDTLRLEMGYPLYGHELTDETNPLCTPYAWVVKDKRFWGREEMFSRPCEEVLVGVLMENGAGIPRPDQQVFDDGVPVGRVTSGGYSPVLERGIALAWVSRLVAEEGTPLEVEVRGRPRPARVHPLPFIRR